MKVLCSVLFKFWYHLRKSFELACRNVYNVTELTEGNWGKEKTHVEKIE